MSAKKRVIIIISVLATVVAATAVLLCLRLKWQTGLNGRSIDEAKDIARNKFSVSAVYFTSSATPKSGGKSHYARYVCGEKDGQTALVYVPALYSEQASEIDWPFAASLPEIAEKAYEKPFADIIDDGLLRRVRLLDNDASIRNQMALMDVDEQLADRIENQGLDVPYMLLFNRCAAIRIDGDIVILRIK